MFSVQSGKHCNPLFKFTEPKVVLVYFLVSYLKYNWVYFSTGICESHLNIVKYPQNKEIIDNITNYVALIPE